jgi:SAM-dependent methyltransferase
MHAEHANTHCPVASRAVRRGPGSQFEHIVFAHLSTIRLGEVRVVGRTAILIVNGFSPQTPVAAAEALRYPWVELCLREISRRSKGADYEIHVWDNSGLDAHRRLVEATEGARLWNATASGGSRLSHPDALDELVARTNDDVEFLLTLDTDALPIADGWIGSLLSHLESGAALVGVWRNEMASELRPFVHVSCLCIRREELLRSGAKFGGRPGAEPGQHLTDEMSSRGRPIVGLERSNAVNPHFLIGGIYGDLVYHHGAGSRPAWFYASADQAEDERVRLILRDEVFRDFGHLVAVLRGDVPDDISPLAAGRRHMSGRMQQHRLGVPPAEHHRPTKPLALERVRSMLVERLPHAGRVVCIGEDAGEHADWLIERGYAVHLIGQDGASAPRVSDVKVRSSRVTSAPCRLPLVDCCADAALLVGPLTYYSERDQRELAVREVLRVLRPGGLFAATALGRLGPLGSAVAFNTIIAPGVVESFVSSLATGVDPDGVPAGGRTYRPQELDADITAAGFVEVSVLAIDGIFGLLSDLEARLVDARSRTGLMRALHELELDPAMVGISETLLAVARRPSAGGARVHPAGSVPAMEPTEKAGEFRADSSPRTDPVMALYYAAGVEKGRLESKNVLEFERTKAILGERLPPAARVIDVGGGPGTYASWLAARGYKVDSVDPIPLHVEQARQAASEGASFEAHLGDARQLPFETSVADAVVMMGPLFHLVDLADRRRALAEALRVIRPGGVIFATAMGRLFLLCHGIATNAVRSPRELDRLLSIVATGERVNPPVPFPAYAHRPEGLRDELTAAGFVDVELLAIESYFHLLGDIGWRLGHPESWKALLKVLHLVEGDPAMVGISGHIMAVARRP